MRHQRVQNSVQHVHSSIRALHEHIEVISDTHFLQKLPSMIRKKAVVLTMIAVPLSSGAGIGAMTIPADQVIQQPIAEIESIVDLTDPIVITFGAKVKDKDYREKITIEPRHEALAQWGDDRTKLIITPQTRWKPQTDYTLTLPSGTYSTEDPIIQTSLSFETAELPSVSTTYPRNDQKDVYFLENEGIDIVFNRELRDYHVDFVITPSIDFAIDATSDRSSFSLIPLEELQAETVYTVLVYADLQAVDGTPPHPIDRFVFTTLPPKPETWPEDFNERLAAAKRFTVPRISDGKYIDVNLEAQVTTLFHDGRFVANFIDSTGTDEEPTPTGEFEIYNKDEYALSNMYQVYLPFWMAFTSDGLYGFHDLPIWPVGHEERPEGGTESLASIGRQASPGCVRHDTDDSQTLFEWSDIGTRVIIY